MSTRKHVLTVAVGDPLDLVSFLVARLGVAAARARWLMERGAVQVDARRVGRKDALAVGARVVVRTVDGDDEPSPAPDASSLRVIHEDHDLIVVDKPAGLLAHASPTEHGTSLADLLARRYGAIHLVHRLDRDASGLLAAARHSAAHAALDAALREGTIERTYRAVVAGRIDAPRTLSLRIATDARDARRRQALPENAPGGQPAITHVAPLGHVTLACGGDACEVTVLAVTLGTGRTHQIRVHLAAIGHPLVGDRLYGGAPFARLLLHAETLRLPHPTTRRPAIYRAPIPDEFPVLPDAPTPPAPRT